MWKKVKNSLYFQYSIAFIVCFFSVFILYILLNKSFVFETDGFMQYIPYSFKMRSLFKEVIRTGNFSWWSWDAGLGADTLGTFSVALFDPFNYIMLLFKKQFVDIGFNISIFLRFYCIGLSMISFLKYNKYNHYSILIGGLGYTFSSWSMGVIRHPFFLLSAIIFPLFIMGLEKVFRKESPILLIIVTAFSCLTNVYFTYMSGIIVSIYYIFRYFYYFPSQGIKKFIFTSLKIIGFVLVGVAMVAPFFINGVIAILNASRTSRAEINIFMKLYNYINFIPNMFAGESVGENMAFFGMASLFLILIPIILALVKKKFTPSIMWLILVIMTLFPVFGYLFNGFSYPTGRWTYALIFFFIWSSMEALKEKSSYVASKRMLIFVGVYTIVIAGLIFGTLTFATCLVIAVNIAFAYLFLFVLENKGNEFILWNRYKIKKGTILIVILIFNVAIINNVKLSPFFSQGLNLFFDNKQVVEQYMDSKQRVAKIIEDENFWRADQVGNIKNESLPCTIPNESFVWGMRTVSLYSSVIDSDWHEFNKMVENTNGYFQRTNVTGNNNRTRLDFLLGVKYFLGDFLSKDGKKTNESKYVAYGYEKKKKISNIEVFRNKFDIGLGCVYNNYMKRSEFLKLTPMEREQAMMQAVILEDDTTFDWDKGVELFADKVETKLETVPFRIAEVKNCELKENKITVTESNAQVTLDCSKVENSEVYLVFKNLKRKTFSLEKEAKYVLKDKANKVMITSYVNNMKKNKRYGNQYEDFTITLKTQHIEKKATNGNEPNSGFSDRVDYYINMGYFDKFENKIDMVIPDLGEYTFDELSVLNVPIDKYEEQATLLMNQKFHTNEVTANRVTGRVINTREGILYCSILNNSGWRAYIDGKEVDKIEKVNIAFTGIKVPEGEHHIELIYLPIFMKESIMISLIAICCFIIISYINKMKIKIEGK